MSPPVICRQRCLTIGSGGRSGVTLIEILVTMCIMMVLAALLVPAISGATWKAKQALSESNLRNIGVGIAGYLADNDNKYPNLSGPGWNQPYWTQRVDEYLNQRPTGKDTAGNDMLAGKIMSDPLLTQSQHHAIGDYGGNTLVFLIPELQIPGLPLGQLTSAQIAYPASLVTVVTASEQGASGPMGSWYINAWGYAWAGGSANVSARTMGINKPNSKILALFADGHTDAISTDEFYNGRWKFLYPPGQQPQ